MYDPTMKKLIDKTADDWASWLTSLLHLPDSPYSLEPPNLSTYQADADRVFRFEKPYPYLLNLEPEASRKAERPKRFLKYSVLLTDKTNLPVLTVVLLLRKEAQSSDLTGILRREHPDGQYLEWRYHLLKVWEFPTEAFLNAGIGLLPMAPLTVDETELPEVIRKIDSRLRTEAPEVVEDVLAATQLLMGLRFSSMVIKGIMKGVWNMEESVVYQEIIRKGEIRGEARGEARGRIETSRSSILLFASHCFGEPTEWQKVELEKIVDADRLARMFKSVPAKTTWEELLRIA